jgi:hypothetical protein
VQLGAFVLIPQDSFAQQHGALENRRTGSAAPPLPLWPVVGKNLLQDWIEKIRHIGAQVLSVTHSADPASDRLKAASDLAKAGVEQVLAISLQSYAEIDLMDFVQFHRESCNPATEAFDLDGPLGVEIVNRDSMDSDSGAQRRPATAGSASEYRFRGYAKRLQSPQLYRDLVSDALRGRCALTPQGSQIDESVWIGKDARIADSVRFFGPCFVGDRTVLQESVSLGPFSSVEHECFIDCGTTVEGSSILPHTFLAAGLSVRRSVVDGPYLEQLESGTIVDLRPSGLGRRFRPTTRPRRDQDGGRHLPTWRQILYPSVRLNPGSRAGAMAATNLP